MSFQPSCHLPTTAAEQQREDHQSHPYLYLLPYFSAVICYSAAAAVLPAAVALVLE